ncbi:MAG: hypothetical protein ACTSRS_08785 [Candidatus Helarchaeota archaeon]
MYELFFIIPLFFLFIILIYHSLMTEGRKETCRFFGAAFLFAFFREFIIGSTFPLYEGHFQIGPVSPAIVIGWVFAFYLAHYFNKMVLQNTRFEGNLFVKISLGTFVVLSISLIMETTAPLLGWWSWRPELLGKLPADAFFLGAPIFVFWGWAMTGAVFLIIHYLIEVFDSKIKVVLIDIILFALIMTNFLICNYILLYQPLVPIL